MSKGFHTKENILKVAFDFTSQFGLQSLSIGSLAKKVGMSKSGLFSHFKSKEKLQLMVLDYAAENFIYKVVKPALKEPRGIARIESIMKNWKKWSTQWLAGGCPFLSSIVEYDDRPGKIRDHLSKLQSDMIATFDRSFQIAQQEGQIRSDITSSQLAYEFYSNMIAFHVYNRLLKDKNSEQYFEVSFNKILNNVRV